MIEALHLHEANDVCIACYFPTRALRLVRPSLPDDVVKTVARSIVGSRLDYCNSLFAGMSPWTLMNFSLFKTHWRVLYYMYVAASVTIISSALAELHWLTVGQRFSFQIAIILRSKLSKKISHPSLLAWPSVWHAPSRRLRSSSRIFANSSNSLPSLIRNCNSLCTFKYKLENAPI